MSSGYLDKIARDNAITLLRRAHGEEGFWASATDITNYRQVWARDGVIVGLAALLSEDDELTQAFRATLLTLAAAQTKYGQIPSSVKIDETGHRRLSFGTISGKVDPTLWFILGVCNYIILLHDDDFAKEMATHLQKALELLSIWELNGRGLLYVPQGGDWADEHIQHGYILLEQLLRLWALRCHAKAYDDNSSAEKAEHLSRLIQVNYWPDKDNRNSQLVYHATAFDNYLMQRHESNFWLPGLTPGGYQHHFDAFANALAILLGLGDSEKTTAVLNHGEQIRQTLSNGMIPSVWEPTQPDSCGWQELQNNYRFEFRNEPGEYQNGGLWPMINGWWGLALLTSARSREARDTLKAIAAFNRKDRGGNVWGFYEYASASTGEPGGTPQQTWSASAMLLLEYGLDGRRLYYG